jgi:hypothetical protein
MHTILFAVGFVKLHAIDWLENAILSRQQDLLARFIYSFLHILMHLLILFEGILRRTYVLI